MRPNKLGACHVALVLSNSPVVKSCEKYIYNKYNSYIIKSRCNYTWILNNLRFVSESKFSSFDILFWPRKSSSKLVSVSIPSILYKRKVIFNFRTFSILKHFPCARHLDIVDSELVQGAYNHDPSSPRYSARSPTP